jgi:hypothetical protein
MMGTQNEEVMIEKRNIDSCNMSVALIPTHPAQERSPSG